MLNYLWSKISYEPALFLEVIKQLLNGLIIFNIVNPTLEQAAFINLFAGMVLQFIVRQTSYPSAKVEDAVGQAEARVIAGTKSTDIPAD